MKGEENKNTLRSSIPIIKFNAELNTAIRFSLESRQIRYIRKAEGWISFLFNRGNLYLLVLIWKENWYIVINIITRGKNPVLELTKWKYVKSGSSYNFFHPNPKGQRATSGKSITLY